MQYSNEILTLAAKAEKALAPHFERIDRISFENTQRVMDAFREFRVSDSMFGSTSGYGYDDRGRDTLDEIWASVMGMHPAISITTSARWTSPPARKKWASGRTWMWCPCRTLPSGTIRPLRAPWWRTAT